jgi:hypothetical protein
MLRVASVCEVAYVQVIRRAPTFVLVPVPRALKLCFTNTPTSTWRLTQDVAQAGADAGPLSLSFNPLFSALDLKARNKRILLRTP